MPTQKVRPAGAPRGSGVSKIYDEMKRDILEMTLRPGDQIDETSLSVRFGLSRTPVREALVKLGADGLVTTLPNRNTIVSPIDLAGLPSYFDAMCLMHRVTARLAAERRKDADIEALRHHQAAFTAAAEANDAYLMISTNRQLHVAVAHAGGNKYYTDLFSKLLDEGTRLLRLYYSTFEDNLPPQLVAEHDAIIDAIVARDADLADEIGRRHAGQIVGQIQAFIASGAGQAMDLAPRPTPRRSAARTGASD